jgi:predicted RNA-binding protein with PIN domain
LPDPTLYLFDGHNLLYAGPYDEPRALVDALASFVALHGARGVVVFDGAGEDAERGPLSVRYVPHADTLLERLAAEHRDREEVLLVTSDATVAAAAGGRVAKRSSAGFFRELGPTGHREERPQGLAGKLDPATRARLEQLRRGE